MRRKNKEMPDIQDVLNKGTVCRLAMTDGEKPYVIPMNYGNDGEKRRLEIVRLSLLFQTG